MRKICIYVEHLIKHIREKGIYGIIYAIKRFIQHTKTYKYVQLYKVKIQKDEEKNTNKIVGMYDPSIETDNVGDCIIMDYCKELINELFEANEIISVPTHIEPDEAECNIMRKVDTKFVCGSSILWGKMESYYQWMIPNDVKSYKGMCLLGVGWNRYDENISGYTKLFYNTLLSKKFIHSVRDEYTKRMLQKMGITNVLNTACPTMWKLTPDFCSTIPKKKADKVITTITDYSQNPKQDKIMFDILKSNYSKVYVWLQGVRDKEYIESIVGTGQCELVEGTLKAYDEILSSEESLDYIGTRLHGGIRALNHRKRSIIVVIDNRAREIAKDTNLVVVERDELNDKLHSMINNDIITNIKIPLDNINMWRQQFRK